MMKMAKTTMMMTMMMKNKSEVSRNSLHFGLIYSFSVHVFFLVSSYFIFSFVAVVVIC